jgi:poly(hydroxyalkanoate) depolymerase family esterase
MNELAEKEGFLVAYPAQAVNANGSKCWNWFRAEDQQRERGEPSLIAGMTREIAAQFGVEDHRIFVAGMSAGAAMAVILGTTYPDLYTAVGAHSGLPYGAAHDAPSAFQAMKGADAKSFLKDKNPSGAAIPTIVFHGDRDTTVNRSNSDTIVERATSGSDAAGRASITQRGRAAGGHEYTRTTFSSATGRPIVEAWIVHGAAHAWSGGNPNGSITESRGPDASSEMLRFFFAQDR